MINMLQTVKKNFEPIIKHCALIIGSLLSGLSIVLSFISWEDIGITDKCFKMLILIGILALGLSASVIWVCFFRKNNQIWSCGAGEINICYGDIMKTAFPQKRKGKKIVVIPVNTCFDTIVDEDIALCDKPLVSPATVHGMWIREMEKHGESVDALDARIDGYIRIKGIEHLKELAEEEKKRGKRRVFPHGEVVVLEWKNDVMFFLLAISEFDTNNNAQSSREKIIESLKGLLSFYDQNGQGYELYCPLLGTGHSRSGLSHKEALQTIKAALLLHSQKIQGKINIVVYYKDRDKVSIFD